VPIVSPVRSSGAAISGTRRYSLDNPPEGKYTVQAVGNGMQSEFKPVDVAAGKAATADVSLATAQHAALPNAWPRRNGDVGGNEIWTHQPNTPLVDGDAKDIGATKCMECHETERIVLLRMDREKWELTVARMRDYGDEVGLGQLTDEEASRVVDYLTKNYSGEPGSVNAWPPSAVYLVASTPDGMIWFSEQASDKTARFDPETRVFTEYPVPTAESDMRRVDTDPSNPNRIWWAGDTSDRIGYVEVLK